MRLAGQVQNGHRNENKQRKSTLEKEILCVLLLGIVSPGTALGLCSDILCGVGGGSGGVHVCVCIPVCFCVTNKPQNALVSGSQSKECRLPCLRLLSNSTTV